MNCTIKDIAKDTSLSLATISKYLNGKNILPANRTLIEKSIKKLGYTPNRTAQTLHSHKTNTICILLPIIGDYFWGTLCSYSEEYLQKFNYSTIVSSYDPYTCDNSEELQLLLSSQVDGVIIITVNAHKMNLHKLIAKANIPFIYLDQVISDPPSDSVTSTNLTSAYEATKYLLERGHRKIGTIGGVLDSYTISERIRGFHKACDEYHIPLKDRSVIGGEFNFQSGVILFRQMMEQPSPPTAILMLGYYLTLGAIWDLNDLNISIPEDLSLVSFDDDEIFSAFDPPITVVMQNLQEIVKQAAKLLIKRINGNYGGFPEKKMIETHFIERSSVKNLI